MALDPRTFDSFRMLFILFQIGRDRYALPASRVIEVLPLMNLKRVPGAPEGVWLREYLQSRRIPYYAFSHAIPGKATAAHIHIGPGSTHLASQVTTRLSKHSSTRTHSAD